MYIVIVLESYKILCLVKKNIIDMYLKNIDFLPTSTAALVTYVPVMAGEQFQFLCRVILMGFWRTIKEVVQTGFCSAKPSTGKESYCYGFQVCCI